MVKLRISYDRPEEIKSLLHALQPFVKHMKAQNTPKGQYKKIYIDIRE